MIDLIAKEFSSSITPCEMGSECTNSPQHTRFPKCSNCKLSPCHAESTLLLGNYWKPITKGLKHPAIVKKKKEASINRRNSRIETRKAKDKGRQKVLVNASKAEELTEKVIQSTVNSGRKLMDGDHTSFGVTLDTKNQSHRVEPVIHWDELDKVRKDAKRSGKAVGGLVLHSSNKRAAVVIALEDWVMLMKAGV